MKKKYIFGIVSIFIILSSMLSFSDVNAAQNYTLLENVPWASKNVNFSTYITGVYNFLVAVVAICALLMITIGGFYYIMAAGNQAQAGTAKKIITDALLGLVVVFITWLILYTINEALVGADPNLSAVRQSATTNTVSQTQNLKQQVTQHTNSRVSMNRGTSTTACTRTGGGVQCYSSAEECRSAGNQDCMGVRDAFGDMPYYACDASGSCAGYEN
jgi:hypothetical protein